MSDRSRGGILGAGAAILLFLGSAAGGESGNGVEGVTYDPREFSPVQKERIERLFGQVMCDCPRESWSRTLAGCPDTCADPQKAEIRDGVKRGLTDQEVLSEQLKIHRGDRRVLSVPEGILSSLFPYLALGGLTAVVLMVIAAAVRPRSKVKSAAPGADERPPAGATDEDRRIGDAVEKDLQEMDG
jgi:hypothetical protein